MKKLFYFIGALLIVGHLASEAHSIAKLFIRNMDKIYVEHWVHVNMPHGRHLDLAWFLALAGQDFMICCFMFAAALQAWCYNYKSYLEWRSYNQRLYIMWGIYFGYHFFDSAMFYVNFKQGYAWYFALLALTIAGTICLMWPMKDQRALYKSML